MFEDSFLLPYNTKAANVGRRGGGVFYLNRKVSIVMRAATGPSIGRYYQLFTALDITSRADLELLFKTHFHHQKGVLGRAGHATNF